MTSNCFRQEREESEKENEEKGSDDDEDESGEKKEGAAPGPWAKMDTPVVPHVVQKLPESKPRQYIQRVFLGVGFFF